MSLSKAVQDASAAIASATGNAPSFRFHHMGVAVPALDRATRVYQDLFGYRLLSGPFEDPIQRVSVCFLEMGEGRDTCLELIAPLAEDSPINGVLSKGGGAYHICLETSDLDQALTKMTSEGCIIVSLPVPAVAFDGRRIAWVFTPIRQLVELVEAAAQAREGGSFAEEGRHNV